MLAVIMFFSWPE